MDINAVSENKDTPLHKAGERLTGGVREDTLSLSLSSHGRCRQGTT
ncbi:hypothetical protein PybrP1_002813 [[Pythium] brassicae (nom. inval.)]|nr:hypothetical protein PybrP1_002813 [[Pythium] brassicae (nom. inval.)]